MKTKKQVYQCSSKDCQNKTTHSMPIATWLQIEVVDCSECGQKICFSTMYPPKKFIRNTVKLP